MTNLCKDCRWWDMMEPRLGKCRRYPAGPRNNDPSAEWVRMRETDWCGEWAAKAEVKKEPEPPKRYGSDPASSSMSLGRPFPEPPRRGPGRPPKDPNA